MEKMASVSSDLSQILTPSLFYAVVKNRNPWPKESTLDFKIVMVHLISEAPEGREEFHKMIFPALKALSVLGLDNVPDLMTLLPPPSSPEFPEQALGLQLLVDQGPRSFCKGVDKRWEANYFDVISQRLAKSFFALPDNLRPWNKERWLGQLGASFDYWMLPSVWFLAPWEHSEHVEDQELAEKWTEHLRIEVEKQSGEKDPNRAKREELFKDTHALLRMFQEGGPSLQGRVTTARYLFWLFTVLNVHKPIIDKFGRYPYRNAGAGRVSTEEEKVWIEETGRFGVVEPDVAEKIMEDVKAGRWTPLGEKYMADHNEAETHRI